MIQVYITITYLNIDSRKLESAKPPSPKKTHEAQPNISYLDHPRQYNKINDFPS